MLTEQAAEDINTENERIGKRSHPKLDRECKTLASKSFQGPNNIM